MQDPIVLELLGALDGDFDDLLERWMLETRQHSWHLRSSPHHADMLKERARMFLVSLMEALQATSNLAIGSPEFREPIKVLSFTAGWLAGIGLPVSAGLALCHALAVVLPVRADEFFRGLVVVVAEAYTAGVREKGQAEHRKVVRRSQVVCMLRRSVAALFLVGDPDSDVRSDAIGRLMMLALMRDATHVLIDGSGLVDPRAELPKTLAMLRAHRDGMPKRSLVITGVSKELAHSLGASAELPVEVFDDVEQALDTIDKR